MIKVQRNFLNIIELDKDPVSKISCSLDLLRNVVSLIPIAEIFKELLKDKNSASLSFRYANSSESAEFWASLSFIFNPFLLELTFW